MNDLKPFKHGEEGTHSCCNARLKKEGGKAMCCYCNPHKDCEFTNKASQPKEWEELKKDIYQVCISAEYANDIIRGVEKLLSQSRDDFKNKIKDLIVKEINVARSENEKTSRLTSLFNKLPKI